MSSTVARRNCSRSFSLLTCRVSSETLAPGPSSTGIPRRFTPAVHASAIANRAGPGGGGGLQLGQQRAPKIEIGLTALEFEETLVSAPVLAGVFIFYCFDELSDYLGRFGEASGKFEPVLQLAYFLIQLHQPQLLEARLQDRRKRIGHG